MRKAIILIFVFLVKICTAQNLVPNGSFEIYSNCPDNLTQIGYAVPWFSPLYPVSTSDYYNACDLTNMYSVPHQGILGNFQYAHTGNAIAGINLYNGFTWREYIEVKLKNPLIANKTYCVNFYVNLITGTTWAIDAIGAYLSADSVLSATATVLPYTPQINNPTNNIITDTVNWVKISGNFLAIGGEQFITIGNFKSNANVNVQNLGGAFVNTVYLFDDVSVYECDAPVYVAEAGSDQTICIGKNDSVQIGTTPQSEYIYWWLPVTGLSNDSIANPKASPSATTTYYLHQKDFKFDETVDSVTVFVKANCDTASVDDIYIPNIFSPNNDGNNDVLYVHSHNIKTMDFCIYNRWGEKVFETKDINKGWDGTYKNSKCNEGVFVWYLSATLMDDRKVEKKGNVTLVR